MNFGPGMNFGDTTNDATSAWPGMNFTMEDLLRAMAQVHGRTAERKPKSREEQAFLEMKRITDRASAQGWKVVEERIGDLVQMTFLHRERGLRVSGDQVKDRKTALASVCGAMQGKAVL